MLDIKPIVTTAYVVDPVHPVQPLRFPVKNAHKRGTIVSLSEAGLDLSHRLEPVDPEKEKERQSQKEAVDHLRHLVARILKQEAQG
jgi:hypothetical protein